ncbi:hypothetical protein IV417_12620 [Alphaproteobacteria bacterium KMM 3653]|uniref:Uncharacterized protein n=1 Tax=Harenicola maris TaxID=2841044 RepID=A0AAP2CPK9_9RHOB|nr:hypothetical protein [Harenicola maris]
MKLSRGDFTLYIYMAPLVILSFPLALPNSLCQPLAILLCLPAIFYGGLNTKGVTLSLLFFGLLTLNSLIQISVHPFRENSAYQAVRSFVPFALMILVIVSYRSRLILLQRSILLTKLNVRKLFDFSVSIFTFCGALQTASYFWGNSFANALSMTDIGTRVMIFQTTSFSLVAFYSMERGKYFSLFCAIVVLLGTGSKSVLVGLVLAMLVATFSKISIRRLIRASLAILVLIGLLVYINPTAFLRILEFAAGTGPNEALADRTRAFEIAHARETLTSSTLSFLFGVGFFVALTPGVPTPDAAFFQNSKYDIENGFWGVLGKLGIFFSMVFSFIACKSIPLNRVILCAILIEIPMFLKTSYQVFAYMDGVYLLLWTLLLSAFMNAPNSSPADLRS